MSTSLALSGTHRSADALDRRNPFTGKMQKVHVYTITPEEQAAITTVLERHQVEDIGDGELRTMLFNERYPDGFPMHGKRTDSQLGFFDRVSTSKPSCVILYDLAATANLAIHGETFAAVTSDEAKARMEDADSFAVVHSADELYELIQRSFEE